ncbi:uncharacterized protein LOC112889036 isoform X2 [Panicum hallii]|uniref:uncharacterized protein LOC112889036 isoform X2 n=1 Tax=Panicum hallii TaxID=206008 RepID=UPI000DF4D945|nr:uncharacterized protein LOC112889036 isoform X2 [Panicum hallii]
MLCQISNSAGPQEGKGRQGRTGSADSDMDVAGLPSDILVEVTASIATRSATPLNDIVNLRRSCKVFRDATAARKVGRCMAVHREWRLHWWDKARFLSVLRRCAASSNPEASYILGLEEFCNRRKASGLRHLLHAMEHGHAAAAYMMGMITLHDSLRSPGGAEQALERLDCFSSAPASSGPSRTRRRMASVRREAVSVMRRLTLRRWRMPEPPTPCANPWCGKVESKRAEAWDGDGDDERYY